MLVIDTLQTTGGIKRKVRIINATATLTTIDDVVFVTNGATNITVTLTTPIADTGREYSISRGIGSTGTITIATPAGRIEALNNTLVATTSLATAGTYGSSTTFISDGTNWLRLNNG